MDNSNATGWRTISLMADRQTTGDYPKFFQVMTADLHLAKLSLQMCIIFEMITMQEAKNTVMTLHRQLHAPINNEKPSKKIEGFVCL